MTTGGQRRRQCALLAMLMAALVSGLGVSSCSRKPEDGRFAAPEDAVRALTDTIKSGDLDALVRLFGTEGRDLVSSSDPATGRKNQEVFLAAVAEQWRLEDRGPDTKELVVGHEDWPFPIPLVKDAEGWRFDAAAGAEEVLARRIGRNELAVIDASRAYVAAQRAYARRGHDGQAAGLYARRFRSDTGTENGLYWPVRRGAPRSPLGDLVAAAAVDGYGLATNAQPQAFHGYHFRILTAQGPAAPGGAMDYIKDGRMSGGFALIAWPANYDATGVMTFIVGSDGTIFEKNLGPETTASAAAITRYDPDDSWRKSVPAATSTP